MADIRIAHSDDEIEACFDVMNELRPHLPRESFVARVRSQEQAGYRIAYLEDDAEPVAVAGFRLLETLASGRFLMVDDLVTLERARSRGHGEAMVRWLCDRAEAEGCTGVQLDSGIQRKDAHRFYERENFVITAYHFARALS